MTCSAGVARSSSTLARPRWSVWRCSPSKANPHVGAVLQADEAVADLSPGGYVDLYAGFVDEFERRIEGSRAPVHYRDLLELADAGCVMVAGVPEDLPDVGTTSRRRDGAHPVRWAITITMS